MNIITSVNDKYFSLNGIRYVRNYLAKPYDQSIEIYNCYDRKDVLLGRVHFGSITVNGATFISVSALQAALLEVTYNRNFGATDSIPVVKPVKNITAATTGFIGNTYTLQPDDDKKWLVFNLSAAFNIRIPAGVFSANAEFEGETIGTGQATFIRDTGISLFYTASELPKTAERYSVFGMKFKTINEVALFGKLALV